VELEKIKREKSQMEKENARMRQKIQEKEERLAQEVELTKVKSLIVQERVFLNDSLAENQFLKKDLDGIGRKSVPWHVTTEDSSLLLRLQQQLQILSSKVDVIQTKEDPSPSSTKAAQEPGRRQNGVKKETKGALKSGAFDRWEDNVVRREKFPHKFIGSYVNSFDASGGEWDVNNIPLTLFFAGFAKILQSDLDFSEEGDLDRETPLHRITTVRDKKLLFLADLMYMAELAGTDGWDSVRKYANRHLRDIESSAEVTWYSYKSNKDMLFMMEQGGTKSKATSHTPWKKEGKGKGKSGEGFSSKPTSSEMKSYTCKRWNNGTCSFQSDHVTNEVLWCHQCNSCLKEGAVSSHKTSDPACPNK
jgi:hypothetical protein